jgi:hypothetical protein
VFLDSLLVAIKHEKASRNTRFMVNQNTLPIEYIANCHYGEPFLKEKDVINFKRNSYVGTLQVFSILCVV